MRVKHGGYSATGLLPGEDRAAFEEHCRCVVDDLSPEGPVETALVDTIAHLLWRRQNLSTFRTAKLALSQYNLLMRDDSDFSGRPREEIKEKEEMARQELGSNYELVAMGAEATVRGLFDALQVEERLLKTIDRCLKHLLHIRGWKSLQNRQAAQTPQAQLPAPTKEISPKAENPLRS